MKELPLEYQREPSLALSSGVDGMDLIRQLLPQMHRYLSPRGHLVLAVGHELGTLSKLYPSLPWMTFDTEMCNDQVLGISAHALAAYFEKP
jgi:ribosomal protein L3 glutamine methyltransferase